MVAQQPREGFALVNLGIRGHASPEIFGFLYAPECNFRLFLAILTTQFNEILQGVLAKLICAHTNEMNGHNSQFRG